jgi:FkbM family methyltransferase
MVYHKSKIGIVGLPFFEIDEKPLETLVGIRVRTWALFEMLPEYGFDTYLYVDPDIPIHQNVYKGHGNRMIRSKNDFLNLCEAEFKFTILCATKIEYLLYNHPWLKKIRSTYIFGAFCYDRNQYIESNILKHMIATTFTTYVQKQLWDKRLTGVPSFIITTGQIAQPVVPSKKNCDSVFIGELRSLRVLRLLCEIANLLPRQNKIYLVTKRIIEQCEQNRVYLDLNGFSQNECCKILSEFVESMGFSLPSNLIYKNIPHGQEKVLLDQVNVGLDFSWSDKYNIENSKVSRYLTYGLFPVVELPAPSNRYLTFFNTGRKLSYNSPAKDWAAAITASFKHDINAKNKLRQKAGNFFNWKNVAFEIGSYLQIYIDRPSKPKFTDLSSLFHLLPSMHKKMPRLYNILISIRLLLSKRQHRFQLLLKIVSGKRLKKFNQFTMLLDPTEYIDQKLIINGVFEVETVTWLKAHLPSNGTFIDIGANIGYFSFLAGEIVGASGRVIAVEPTTYSVERLKENLKLNSFKNIEIHKLAFSERKRKNVNITYSPKEYQSGTDRSIRSSWKMTSNGVCAVHAGKADSCDFISLDEFVTTNKINKIDVIKIDVDGGEEKVLLGAMLTIERLKPVLIIELSWNRNVKTKIEFSSKLKQALSKMFDCGYSAFNNRGKKYGSVDELLIFLHSVSNQPTSPNILFVRK